MEENHSLFSLSIDTNSKEHLGEAAKWARFLAVVGFVFLGLLILVGLFASVTFSRLNTSPFYGNRSVGNLAGITTAIVYIIMAVVYFFPLLYLFRFATEVKKALDANDQERLIVSFQNLKAFFRYVGIVTIIALVFMAIGIIGSLVSLAALSS